MKIVVLDGHTLNPGDLSWDALAALGPCEIYDRTPPEQVVARAQHATIALTNKTVLGRAEIERLPGLRYIGVLATGYNVVDLDAARARDIVVTNVPAYSTPSVVQLTFALLLELTSQVGHHARAVAEGRWTRSLDFCFWETPLVELAGRTLGLVGFGQIGQRVADVARAFGMTGVVHTANPQKHSAAAFTFTDLETLFRGSDVVSLHCPLTRETEHLIDRRRLAWMKPTAYLINTGRGRLVDEAALAEALNEGRIAGAGLDVLSSEPPAPDNPLLSAKHCLITPHIGWATKASRERLMNAVVENVRAFLSGTPRNVVT